MSQRGRNPVPYAERGHHFRLRPIPLLPHPKSWRRAGRSSRSLGSILLSPMRKLAMPACVRKLDLRGAGADRSALPGASLRFVLLAYRFLASVLIHLGRAIRSSWKTSSSAPMCSFRAGGGRDRSCRSTSVHAWHGCLGCYWLAESP